MPLRLGVTFDGGNQCIGDVQPHGEEETKKRRGAGCYLYMDLDLIAQIPFLPLTFKF